MQAFLGVLVDYCLLLAEELSAEKMDTLDKMAKCVSIETSFLWRNYSVSSFLLPPSLPPSSVPDLCSNWHDSTPCTQPQFSENYCTPHTTGGQLPVVTQVVRIQLFLMYVIQVYQPGTQCSPLVLYCETLVCKDWREYRYGADIVRLKSP